MLSGGSDRQVGERGDHLVEGGKVERRREGRKEGCRRLLGREERIDESESDEDGEKEEKTGYLLEVKRLWSSFGGVGRWEQENVEERKEEIEASKLSSRVPSNVDDPPFTFCAGSHSSTTSFNKSMLVGL